MKKILLGITVSGALLLGACGNADSEESKNSHLSADKQEDVYKKESKKLGEAFAEEGSSSENITQKDADNLDKAIERYDSKTKNLNDVETEIGDYASKTAKTISAFAHREIELNKFKKNNPDLEKAHDLAETDVIIEMAYTLDSIKMEYDELDADYKNQYLGKKGNEEVTDILAQFDSTEFQDVTTGYGAMIIDYDETLNDNQNKILSNTDYRKIMNKQMITEEPDISKNEYNKSVDEFNQYAPEFLQRDKVNKMISTTEYNYLADLRNGVIGANTDSETESFEDAEEETDEDISSSDIDTEDTGGWSADSYNELVDEYNSLTDGEKMDHVNDDVLDIEYEQLEERVSNLENE